MTPPIRATPRRPRWTLRLLLGAVAWWALTSPTPAAAQAAPVVTDLSALPFAVGERLTYTVHAGRLGKLGTGSMWVTDTANLRGTAVWILHFGFQARKGPIKVVNKSESWIDPRRMASLRFHKHERHPLSNHDEQIEMFPAEQRWEGSDGSAGTSLSNLPLDELSFIYFLRTLPLDSGTTLELDRHFDENRNPTVIRVLGHETVETPAGSFRTIVVEMRVKDRRYKGEGVIRFNFSDDACRLPIRIESAAPMVGKSVLTLESHTHAPSHFAVRP